MVKNGGKVLDSGGFGCVFRPEIKCNTKKTFLKNGISKVMIKKYAVKEFDEIKRFIPILKTIPNYSNYFIITNYSICRPLQFTKGDLIDFKNCSALKKKGITENNINNNLDQLLAINMPYGGIEIDKYIKINIYNLKKIILFNEKMIDLLLNALLPMNSRGIYHGDLKSNNILVNEVKRNIFLKIIDWGLSFMYKDDDINNSEIVYTDIRNKLKFIPEKIINRPFQYNVPFSSILFSEDFLDSYTYFLKINMNYTEDKLYDFIINFFNSFIGDNRKGHLSVSLSIFKLYDDISNKKNDDIGRIEYIYNYLYKIIVKYTKNNYFDIIDYFRNVYRYNIDVWGFIMSYLPLCENACNKTFYYYNNLLKEHMKNILELLFKYSDEPINIRELKEIIIDFNNKLISMNINPTNQLFINNKNNTKKRRSYIL